MGNKKFIETVAVNAEEKGELHAVAGIAGIESRSTRRVFAPGAIKAPLEVYPGFYDHDSEDLPIIKWTVEVEEKQLNLVGTVDMEDAKGAEVWRKVKSGFLTQLSLGYIAKEIEHLENGQTLVKNAELLEISVVSIPEDGTAKILHTEKTNTERKDEAMTIDELKTQVESLEKTLTGKIDEITSSKTEEDLAEAQTALQSAQDELAKVKQALADELAKATEPAPEPEAPEPEDEKMGVKAFEKFAKTSDFKREYVDLAKDGDTVGDVDAKFLKKSAEKFGVQVSELLPVFQSPVLASVIDAFDNGGGILATVAKVNGTYLKHPLQTATGEPIRAKGHKGSGAVKADQAPTFDPIEIKCQYIYKRYPMSREDWRENKEANQSGLVEWITKELPQQIVNEIERAIIIGDGRTAGSNDKVSSFVSIAEETRTELVAVDNVVSANRNDVAFADAVSDLLLSVRATGRKYYAMSLENLKNLRKIRTANGALAVEVKVDENGNSTIDGTPVFTPTWLDGVNDVYAWADGAYEVVGDASIESNSNDPFFKLENNQLIYQCEIYAGGRVAKFKGAAKLVVASATSATKA